jgi:hypothetical protein
MQAIGETNADACSYNDFAVVRIAAADVGKVNPSIPHWGGPTGTNTAGNAALARVYSYGNSSLRYASGRASGVLSTVAIAPLTGSNNFSDLHRALGYARSHGVPGLTLALGTEAFNPNALPLGA